VLVDVQLVGDPLDGPGGVVEVGRVGDLHVDHVPDAVLVLHEHEDAGDEVADQVLGAEPDGHADDPGDQRPQVEAEGTKGHQPGQGPDAEGGHAGQQGAHRLGPLDPA